MRLHPLDRMDGGRVVEQPVLKVDHDAVEAAARHALGNEG